MIEFGHATHTGLLRAHNEDTYWADVGHGLFVVAGGIGGPGRGERASLIARRAVVDAVRRGCDPERALADAAHQVGACARGHAGDGPLGATLAILCLEADRYTAASIGDAHLFCWCDGRLWPVHTTAATSAGTGPARAAAQPAAASEPHRSTQALGITPPDELHPMLASGTLEPGTQFLMCSAGIGEELDAHHLAAILARTELAAQECVDHLILAALDAGGRDNLTALLVRIH